MTNNSKAVDRPCCAARYRDTARVLAIALGWLLACCLAETSRAKPPGGGPEAAEKIIIDTDIGGDIDDAFAIALALQSPDVQILGISTASGDTEARAKILDRMLGESGHEALPVAVGVPTQLPSAQIGAQGRYGEGGHYARASHPAAADFILAQINRFPAQITLVSIGPLSNLGQLMDKDISTFRKLKRVVMMGGWIQPVNVAGVGELTPAPETNVVLDINSAKKLLQSGVQLDMITFDSTVNLSLDEVERRSIFYRATPITDALALLYVLWSGSYGGGTPVLYDAMAVAFATRPDLCPVKPMHVVVDDDGMTRATPGPANAQVCLHSDRAAFIDYFTSRLEGMLH